VKYLSLLHDKEITDEITVVPDLGARSLPTSERLDRQLLTSPNVNGKSAALSRSTAAELREAGLAGAEIAASLACPRSESPN